MSRRTTSERIRFFLSQSPAPGLLDSPQPLRLAEDEQVPFAPAEISLDELKRADEVMLLGTSMEVLPVVKIDDTPIAGGRPGPIAHRLQAAHRRAVERWLAAPPA